MTITAHRHRPGNSNGWRRGSEVDVAAVLRACRGEQMPLTTAERREAVRRLVAEGLSINQVAERLHLDWRTAQRHRADLLREGAISAPRRRVDRGDCICRRCHRDRQHAARGLCNSCYAIEHRAGGLEQWPPAGRGRRDLPPPPPVDPSAPVLQQTLTCDWCRTPLTRSRRPVGEPLYEVYTVAGRVISVCFEICPADRVLELTGVSGG